MLALPLPSVLRATRRCRTRSEEEAARVVGAALGVRRLAARRAHDARLGDARLRAVRADLVDRRLRVVLHPARRVEVLAGALGDAVERVAQLPPGDPDAPVRRGHPRAAGVEPGVVVPAEVAADLAAAVYPAGYMMYFSLKRVSSHDSIVRSERAPSSVASV